MENACIIVERSKFIITHRGVLYAFGDNSHGQLGLGHDNEVESPTRVDLPEKIISIKNASIHMFALTDTGDVYSWSRYSMSKPEKIIVSVKFISICCGWNHIIGLTATGDVYAWGSNKVGQLGVGCNPYYRRAKHSLWKDERTTPTQVCFPEGEKCISIFCKGDCSYASSLTNNYIWGRKMVGLYVEKAYKTTPTITSSAWHDIDRTDRTDRTEPILHGEEKFLFIWNNPYDSIGITDQGNVYEWGKIKPTPCKVDIDITGKYFKESFKLHVDWVRSLNDVTSQEKLKAYTDSLSKCMEDDRKELEEHHNDVLHDIAFMS